MNDNMDKTNSLPELNDQESTESLVSGISKPRMIRADEDLTPPRGNMQSFNWLSNIPSQGVPDIVRVQFKNTRFGFYRNSNNLPLKIGDMVAVEASPGHDIGEVTMVGPLVRRQMKKARVEDNDEMKKVFRIARQNDLEKFEEAKALEHDTMIRSRKIAESLELEMKIGDVEYQGDGSKAIFYYIANERVDFRKLIKILAETFKIRIEMKQIGARQEAGRIGGIGPCGRPLCCASWLSHFVSVGTSAARFQDISMNPQKLAGQCSKLKCCLNFEVDEYIEAGKKCPSKDIQLETLDNTYYLFKTDILRRLVTYSTDKHIAANTVTISAKRAFEVIGLNKKGIKPESLETELQSGDQKTEFVDLVGQDSLTRFDKTKKKKKKKKTRNLDNNPEQIAEQINSNIANSLIEENADSEKNNRNQNHRRRKFKNNKQAE